MSSSRKYELTAAERARIELDKKVNELVQRVVPPDPDGGELPEGAIVAGDVEYWASGGNVAKVKEAINAGCDVNAASEGGYTALHAAAENGHVEIARILIESGADQTAKLESGEAPIDLARLAGKDEVLDYLRSIGGV